MGLLLVHWHPLDMGEGVRPACYWVTSASHLSGDLNPSPLPPAAHHICEPPLVITLASDPTPWDNWLGGGTEKSWDPSEVGLITAPHLLLSLPQPSSLSFDLTPHPQAFGGTSLEPSPPTPAPAPRPQLIHPLLPFAPLV